MPTGLGDEQLWLCPTLDNVTPFDDLSDQGNNGTAVGGLSTVADTGAGGAYCYDFDGTDDYIDGSLSTALGSSVSSSCWIKFDAAPTAIETFISNDGFTTDGWLVQRLASSQAKLRYAEDASVSTFCDNSYLNSTNWRHIVSVRDGSTVSLYIDGVQLAVTNSSITGAISKTAFNIGRRLDSASQYSACVMDDIRFYNRVLTQSEITHLATARGIEGRPFDGLGDEQLWLCPSLENSPNDLSGNNNNGVYQNGMGTVTDTAEGGSLAYDFDGANDYITYPIAAIDSANSIGSVSAWVKTGSTASPGGQIIGGSDTASTNAWSHLRLDSGEPTVVTYSSGQVGEKQSSTNVNDSSWHHICAVGDGSDCSIYIDGTLVSSSWIGTPRGDRWLGYPAGMDTGLVGALVRSVGVGNLFNGKMDDIRAYNRVLTQAEISWLATGRGVLGTPPEGLGDEQLWLCPSIQDSANDLSGNGNDGVYQGGAGTISDVAEGGTRSYEFTNSSHYITGTTDLDTTDDFSLSYWYRSNTGNSFSTNYHIFRARNGTRGFNFYKYYSGNTQTYTGTTICRGGALSFSNTPVNYGIATSDWLNWHCFTMNWDNASSTMEYFIDGVSVGTWNASVSGSVDATGTTMILGALGNGTGTANGYVDDLRKYSRKLTQSEISWLATERGVLGTPPEGLGDEQLWWCPTLSSSVGLDSSGYGKVISHIGSAPTLVADTDAGGEYAGQIPNSGAVRVEDPVQFMTTGDCSAAGWIKASSSATLAMIGQQAGGSASTKSGEIVDQYFGQNRVKFFDGVNNDELLLQGGNAVPNNTWYHVATTKEGSTCKLFVNGVLLASGTQIGIPSNPDYKDLLIGAAWSGSNPVYGGGGYIDDVRLYTRALTQSEITHLASQRGVLGTPNNCGIIRDMTYWSDLDDGTSATLADDNGGSDVLTRNGGATDATGSPRSSACVNYGTSAANYHSLNGGANQPAPPSDYSFSIWARCTGSGATGAWIANQRRTTPNAGWIIKRTSAGLVGFSELAGGSAARSVEVTPMSLNTWYLLSFSRDNTGLYAYVNGSLVGSDTTSMTQGTESAPLRLGTAAWNPSNANFKFNGQLWSCGMWDRVLTASEHSQLYQSGQGLLYSEICPATTTQYNAFVTHAFRQLFQTRIR